MDFGYRMDFNISLSGFRYLGCILGFSDLDRPPMTLLGRIEDSYDVPVNLMLLLHARREGAPCSKSKKTLYKSF